ncbi:cholinesterase [Helicoverpa armigera]|uniref:cholinesterase n=1 Tax=Helicoverpa armigera TaxID=29058 RepID=UPI003083911C
MISSRRLYFLIFFSIQNYNVECLPRIDPLVDTNVGLIRGLKADDGDYAMFLGIPYAQVNQDNPFGESTPQNKFEQIFEANDDSSICPQRNQITGNIVGNPNCLHLNVYVPASASSSNRLPVMVWIYGGAFHAGSKGKGRYGSAHLVQHDVIIVTVNYRVGAYGFMCLDIPEVPGNQGLKDQLLALRWVKDNIDAFGGDSDKITLFGESAGGHSIDLHLLSPKEILYNKVILQSGSAYAATVLYEPDRLVAIKIAKRLGFTTADTKEALSFLTKSDPSLIVAAGIALNIMFKPCTEKIFDGVEPFISNSWLTAETPKAENMPILIGFNKHELYGSYLFKNEEFFENLNVLNNTLDRIFDFGNDEQDMKESVSHFYFGDESFSDDVKFSIGNFDSDFVYIHPIQRTIQKYLKARSGNIYYYMFSYVGGRNVVKLSDEDNDSNDGPCCALHADDLAYLFDMDNKPAPTAEDEVIINRMTTMWTNFAKYSDPTPQITELLPVKWEPLSEEAYTYMEIGSELSLGSRPAHHRMAFWNLFYKLNENKQRLL